MSNPTDRNQADVALKVIEDVCRDLMDTVSPVLVRVLASGQWHNIGKTISTKEASHASSLMTLMK